MGLLLGLGAMALAFSGTLTNSDSAPGTNGGSVESAEPVVEAAPDAPQRAPEPKVLGEIDGVSVVNNVATIRGWAADPNSDQVLKIEVLVEGTQWTVLDADEFRADIDQTLGISGSHGFVASVPVSNAGNRVCVFTVPDGHLVECERVAAGGNLGVLVTPTGVVTPIIEEHSDGYLVFTPCANQAVVSRGHVVRTAQIVLDPGHGGIESSTVAYNGLMEKDVNLTVSLILLKKLSEAGYSVQMTRTTDLTMPIPTRTEIANVLDPDLFVSVHHNGGATVNLGRPGTGVYYQSNDPEAKRLGGILYEDLYAAALQFPTSWVGTYLDGATSRLNDSGGDFYGIHRRTPGVTSIITEWLWMNNPAEADLLLRPEVLEAEAQALFDGIDRWYRTENTGSGYKAPFIDSYDSGGGGYAGCIDPVLE